MIGVSLHSNSVYIPLVSTGCCEAHFDSTYPIDLNDIISPKEFEESINKINLEINSNKSFVICCMIIYPTAMMGAAICYLINLVMEDKPRIYGFPILNGVGFVLQIFGLIFFVFEYCIMRSQRLARMRQAITEESMKYLLRSPTPCSWRLDTTTYCTVRYGNYHNNQLLPVENYNGLGYFCNNSR